MLTRSKTRQLYKSEIIQPDQQVQPEQHVQPDQQVQPDQHIQSEQHVQPEQPNSSQKNFTAHDIIRLGIIQPMNIRKYTENKNLPQCLKETYRLFGSPLSEFRIGRWCIYSLIDADNMNQILFDKNEHSLHIFAECYIGMGWILRATIDMNNGKVFIHRDGGSNGYQVTDNLNKLLLYRINERKYNYMTMSYNQFIQRVINEDILNDNNTSVLLESFALW